MTRPTALLIPCPWSGDANDPMPRAYPLWSWLYRTTRALRHWLGLHDWRHVLIDDHMRYCTWCGRREHLR